MIVIRYELDRSVDEINKVFGEIQNSCPNEEIVVCPSTWALNQLAVSDAVNVIAQIRDSLTLWLETRARIEAEKQKAEETMANDTVESANEEVINEEV